ncbi:hypothetical protein AKJ09_10632 [Labilithrix luteola]|uniref:Uncharacterized protein n=1 Tax=Labilithrix luteola TaxID=1391654 RepID=A0A0K1QDY1_9BACT|nr:hypothetical protein [Labilithrix luteola]AKV03969.1 hypothetical protein AKJ09_10632 [Labilithrix luteola]
MSNTTTNLRYAYSPTSRQREVTMMRYVDDVRAKRPMGALRFGAYAERRVSALAGDTPAPLRRADAVS